MSTQHTAFGRQYAGERGEPMELKEPPFDKQLLAYAVVPQILHSLVKLFVDKKIITRKEWKKIADDAIEVANKYMEEHCGDKE